jgi:AsmA family protein
VTKRRGWILGTLGAVVILLISVLVVFDWNWLKGPIESQVSGSLGRPFRINGDLEVEPSLQPRIIVESAELDNAPWGSDEPMAKIDRVEVTVDLLELLEGEIVLPEIRIARPALLLETRPDGPPNWQFGRTEETVPGPPALPRIGRLEVSDASIRYHDFGTGQNVTAALPRIAGRTDPDLKLNATGKVQREPLDLEITGAALAQLENHTEPSAGSPPKRGTGAPYAIEARIRAGQTRITASGNISKQAQPQGVEIAFDLTSPDLTELLRAFGMEAATLPPLRAAGKVIRKDQVWQLNDLDGQVGKNNVAGRLSVDLSRSRPFISADLNSDRLRTQDLKITPSGPPEPAGTDKSREAANQEHASESKAPRPFSRRRELTSTHCRRWTPT